MPTKICNDSISLSISDAVLHEYLHFPYSRMFKTSSPYEPKKIIHNKKATIVFWKDGTKTVVKRMKGTKDDIYTAFTAALAKKVYGNNSQIKKILKGVIEQ